MLTGEGVNIYLLRVRRLLFCREFAHYTRIRIIYPSFTSSMSTMSFQASPPNTTMHGTTFDLWEMSPVSASPPSGAL